MTKPMTDDASTLSLARTFVYSHLRLHRSMATGFPWRRKKHKRGHYDVPTKYRGWVIYRKYLSIDVLLFSATVNIQLRLFQTVLSLQKKNWSKITCNEQNIILSFLRYQFRFMKFNSRYFLFLKKIVYETKCDIHLRCVCKLHLLS
jgi:hypothetical protein